MGTVTYTFGKGAIKRIVRGMTAPIKDTKAFFSLLGIMIDNDTKLTFKRQGARSGAPAWPKFSPHTLRTRAGTPKIRYGTDLRGRPRGTYKPGVKRKGKIRRYAPDSKLLQASGSFKRSFGIQSVTEKRLKYGTSFAIADKIMRSPRSPWHRPVLFITAQDEARYGRRFKDWWLKEMTF